MSFWQQILNATGMGTAWPWIVLVFIIAALVLLFSKPGERMRIRTALALFERQGIPHLDVSECNVEEIASRILDRMKLERRVRV